MQPRDRVLAALDHREADRVPRDLAGTRYSSIHAEAYARLRPALGLPEADDHHRGHHAGPGPRPRRRARPLRRGRGAGRPAGRRPDYRREVVSDGEYERFVDEWGVVRARPLDGLYYESSTRPCRASSAPSDVAAFAWPDPRDPGRFAGMAERARHIREVERRAVFVGSLCAGVREMHFRLRGYEDGYMDLAADPALARQIMETGHRAQARLLGTGPRRDRRPHRHRRGGRRPGRPARTALLAADLPGASSSRSTPSSIALHQAPLAGTLLPALLRRHPRPHPGPHRDRRGLPEPRPGLGDGHGHGRR